jgi:L-threonylcarbamoyladenylate synthase
LFTGNEWRLAQAARVVRAGGVIAYPTEGVFGLGVDPWQAAAVARLTALKGRRAARRYVIVAARLADVEPYVRIPGGAPGCEVRASWPGPVTWILPCTDRVPAWLRGPGETLAVRVTAHPLAVALCNRTGPLVSTSANRAGRPPARDPLSVRHYFHGDIDFLLCGRLGGGAGPTEIRDGRSGRVVRPAGNPH